MDGERGRERRNGERKSKREIGEEGEGGRGREKEK